ncbi:TERF2 isoform 12, partial [Pan troglodytes]
NSSNGVEEKETWVEEDELFQVQEVDCRRKRVGQGWSAEIWGRKLGCHF